MRDRVHPPTAANTHNAKPVFEKSLRLAHLRVMLHDASGFDTICRRFEKYKRTLPCAGVIVLDETCTLVCSASNLSLWK